MQAIVLEEPKHFKSVQIDEPAAPGSGEALGARASRRNLRHRYQRLSRQVSVLQLSAHSRA